MSAADYAIRLYSPDGGTEVANLTRCAAAPRQPRGRRSGRIEIRITDYITSTSTTTWPLASW